ILDHQLSTAARLSEIMPCILAALRGRILIVHSAAVDVAFLDAACKQLYGVSLAVHVVDTVALGMRRYRHEQREILLDHLRLHSLRREYHLPDYHAHHALSDALATAELFLAMSAHIAGKQRIPVRRLLAR